MRVTFAEALLFPRELPPPCFLPVTVVLLILIRLEEPLFLGRSSALLLILLFESVKGQF